MKKIIMMALVLVASASCYVAGASTSKKDKKKKATTEQVAQPEVKLLNGSDSLSYAAGKAFTMGLQQFLAQQFGVNANDSNFLAGFRAGVASGASEAKKAYNAGLQIAGTVQDRMLPQAKELFEGTPDSVREQLLYKGFEDALAGNSKLMADSTAEKLFNDTRIAVAKQKEEAYKAENTKWLEDNKTKAGVVTLPSGLQYKVLKQGNGEVAKTDDEVEVKYEGKLIDGTVFDSSYKRNPQTSKFRPSQVIKGWTEALTMMPVGSTWELYIPQELAYGSRQAGKIKPYSTLIFKVELVAVHHPEPKQEAKPAVKAGAKTATKVAAKGKAARRPAARKK